MATRKKNTASTEDRLTEALHFAEKEAAKYKRAHEVLELAVKADLIASVNFYIVSAVGWEFQFEFHRKLSQAQRVNVNADTDDWEIDNLRDSVTEHCNDLEERRNASALVKKVWDRMTPAEQAAWRKTSNTPSGVT